MKKKYAFLTIELLKEELIDNKKSMSQLAEELAEKHKLKKINLAGSIRFLVYRYFSPEQRSQMGRDRKFHRNKKKPMELITPALIK